MKKIEGIKSEKNLTELLNQKRSILSLLNHKIKNQDQDFFPFSDSHSQP